MIAQMNLGDDFIEPECLFPKDKQFSENGTLLSDQRTLIMPETIYEFEDGTTCYPRCGGGKHRLGKKQYKCSCKKYDADRCVWGGIRRNKKISLGKLNLRNGGKKTTEQEMSNLLLAKYSNISSIQGGKRKKTPLEKISNHISSEHRILIIFSKLERQAKRATFPTLSFALLQTFGCEMIVNFLSN